MLESFLIIPQEYINMKINGYIEELYFKLVERDYKRLNERIKTGKRDELVPLYHELQEKNLLINAHRNFNFFIKPNTLRQILIDNIWYEYSQKLCLFMFGNCVIVVHKHEKQAISTDEEDEEIC